MVAIGERAQGPGVVYFIGGDCVVCFGWRDSTVDVNLSVAPEPAGPFSAIKGIKLELGLNIELTSPAPFVPPRPAWLAGWLAGTE